MSSDDYIEMVLARSRPSTPAVEKTHADCKVPGCFDPGTFQPYDFAPNCRFCERHAMALIGATLEAILSAPETD